MDVEAGTVVITRVYNHDQPKGGHRVLVDRLWPRGLTHEEVGYDEWCKEIAPSTELRRWYDHQADRFAEFEHRYLAELSQAPESAEVDRLTTIAKEQGLVLLTATKDVALSEAEVLKTLFERRLAS